MLNAAGVRMGAAVRSRGVLESVPDSAEPREHVL
jgi:hypothetical protein